MSDKTDEFAYSEDLGVICVYPDDFVYPQGAIIDVGGCIIDDSNQNTNPSSSITSSLYRPTVSDFATNMANMTSELIMDNTVWTQSLTAAKEFLLSNGVSSAGTPLNDGDKSLTGNDDNCYCELCDVYYLYDDQDMNQQNSNSLSKQWNGFYDYDLENYPDVFAYDSAKYFSAVPMLYSYDYSNDYLTNLDYSYTNMNNVNSELVGSFVFPFWGEDEEFLADPYVEKIDLSIPIDHFSGSMINENSAVLDASNFFSPDEIDAWNFELSGRLNDFADIDDSDFMTADSIDKWNNLLDDIPDTVVVNTDDLGNIIGLVSANTPSLFVDVDETTSFNSVYDDLATLTDNLDNSDWGTSAWITDITDESFVDTFNTYFSTAYGDNSFNNFDYGFDYGMDSFSSFDTFDSFSTLDTFNYETSIDFLPSFDFDFAGG